jgi:hypothetical protein
MGMSAHLMQVVANAVLVEDAAAAGWCCSLGGSSRTVYDHKPLQEPSVGILQLSGVTAHRSPSERRSSGIPEQCAAVQNVGVHVWHVHLVNV